MVTTSDNHVNIIFNINIIVVPRCMSVYEYQQFFFVEQNQVTHEFCVLGAHVSVV